MYRQHDNIDCMKLDCGGGLAGKNGLRRGPAGLNRSWTFDPCTPCLKMCTPTFKILPNTLLVRDSYTNRNHCPSHEMWSYERDRRWWGWSFVRGSTVLWYLSPKQHDGNNFVWYLPFVIYWLLPEQSRVDNYRATRLERDLDDSHENLYLYLNMCVTINYQIHDILATRMGCSGL